MTLFVIVIIIGLYAIRRRPPVVIRGSRPISGNEMMVRWILMILLIVILVGAVHSLFGS
jgi:hypothetical protein